MSVLAALAGLSLAAWVWLLLFHHRFWRASEVLPRAVPERADWPAVTAVVPARNEAATVADALASLLAQDYPGALSVILVDDGSADGTRAAAAALAASDPRLEVVAGASLPPGWSGKLWAVAQGVERGDSPFVFLTDADTVHAPDTLRRLVAQAEGRDLVSLMVVLACASFWERLLVPAFVFFFQMLYPFPAVNDRASRVAGAAGACILVRRAALERIGGIAAVRGALIDDCALAAAVKRSGGALWLGLAERSFSLRRYARLGEFWRMVARTAYTQLRHSPLLLAGTVLGLALVYLVPPVALVAGAFARDWTASLLGAAAWTLMCIAYVPTLVGYRQPAELAFALPAVAALYLAMTLDSALRHALGRGGAWKGRTYP